MPPDSGRSPRRNQPIEHIRGARLGLPPEGPGSLATFGRRAAAFAIDAFLSALVASLFSRSSWMPLSIAGMLLVGKTLGQHLLGLRVVRVDQVAPVTPWRAIVRTALLVLFLPAVIVDKDGRGMHDRATDTAVING